MTIVYLVPWTEVNKEFIIEDIKYLMVNYLQLTQMWHILKSLLLKQIPQDTAYIDGFTLMQTLNSS